MSADIYFPNKKKTTEVFKSIENTLRLANFKKKKSEKSLHTNFGRNQNQNTLK